MRDIRFSVKEEYCGNSTRRFVVRFCGEFVCQHPNKIIQKEFYKGLENGKISDDFSVKFDDENLRKSKIGINSEHPEISSYWLGWKVGYDHRKGLGL